MLARHFAQAECIIEFSVGEQTCIGGDDGATKLNHKATVKIEPQNAILRFTRRVRRRGPIVDALHAAIIRQFAKLVQL